MSSSVRALVLKKGLRVIEKWCNIDLYSRHSCIGTCSSIHKCADRLIYTYRYTYEHITDTEWEADRETDRNKKKDREREMSNLRKLETAFKLSRSNQTN